jgi:6-phosphofructokinase
MAKQDKTEVGNFGIVVSGGPAPGINSVIASVVSCAQGNGYRTFGFQDGFSGLSSEQEDQVVELKDDYTSPISTQGGSMLGTSRFNPFESNERREAMFARLKKYNIDKLVVIGGEGSAYLSNQMNKHQPLIKIAHIPKTIDNDLILPNKHPSFGFETARSVGTNILKTLLADARTTKRWFIVKTMGRKAGFLAMGTGIAAGASITLIAEQFEDRSITPDDVAKLILNSIKKRLAVGKSYGTAVIAEGILDKFDPERVAELADCPRDDMGRLRLSEVGLEDLVAKSLKRMCKEEGINIRFTAENIGYELRCHDPISFDIEYTKLLGYGAVKYLHEGLGGIMVVRDFDNLAYVPLVNMLGDDETLRTRKVDLNSDIYRVASSFMTR